MYCPFCDNLELKSRTVDESKHFIIFKDKHPTSDFHFLIASKKHILSMSSLNELLLNELRILIETFNENLNIENKKVHLFERGNKFENKTQNISVDHAHVHFITIEEDLIKHLPQNKIPCKYSDYKSFLSKTKNSYFYYEDLLGRVSYFGDASTLESQFIRKISGKLNNKTNWNWKEKQV